MYSVVFMDLNHYGCVTAAGFGVDELMQGLYQGVDHSSKISGNEWDRPVSPGGRICFLGDQPRKNFHYEDFFILQFQSLWNEFYNPMTDNLKEKFRNSNALFLFSSTKGAVEDFIWQEAKDLNKLRRHADPYESLVGRMQTKIAAVVKSIESVVVSGACSSSHVAFEMAQKFLEEDQYDVVFVVAGDLIGPFIYQGFNSLKILSHTRNRPFSTDRDGLQLGEAVTFFILSKNGWHDHPKSRILNVATETEGGSVTRPSVNGESLSRVLMSLMKNLDVTPDFFVAHGTGTRFNDTAEAGALEHANKTLRILSIKWSIGHCLGASGALDLIVASEVLKRKKYFETANSKTFDPALNGIFSGSEFNSGRRAIVSSLGFGGIHGAVLIEGCT